MLYLANGRKQRLVEKIQSYFKGFHRKEAESNDPRPLVGYAVEDNDPRMGGELYNIHCVRFSRSGTHKQLVQKGLASGPFLRSA